jgi:hypothetical protein
MLNLKKLNNAMVSWLNNLFVVNSPLVIFIVLIPFKLQSWFPCRFRNGEHKHCSTLFDKMYLNTPPCS